MFIVTNFHQRQIQYLWEKHLKVSKKCLKPTTRLPLIDLKFPNTLAPLVDDNWGMVSWTSSATGRRENVLF